MNARLFRTIATVAAACAGLVALLASYVGGVSESAPPRSEGVRVIGGDPVPDGKYPWVVEIEKRLLGSDDSWRHACGASLVGETRVLTAAHCVTSDRWERRLVFNRASRDDPAEVTVSDADFRTVIYDGYDWPEGKPIDINDPTTPVVNNLDAALLLLDAPITGITPIEVAPVGTELLGRTSTVAGWGLTVGDDPTSGATRLQEVDLQIHDIQQCLPFTPPVAPICAGDEGHDIAGGDSGSPLFIIDPGTGRPLLVGIISNVHTNITVPDFWDGFPHT